MGANMDNVALKVKKDNLVMKVQQEMTVKLVKKDAEEKTEPMERKDLKVLKDLQEWTENQVSQENPVLGEIQFMVVMAFRDHPGIQGNLVKMVSQEVMEILVLKENQFY